MRDVEVATHQLGGEIGVDVIGIELIDEILQLRAVRLQCLDPLLSLLEHGYVLSPGEQPIGPGQGKPSEEEENAESAETGKFLPYCFALCDRRAHARTESQLTRRFKRFCREVAVIRK